MAHKHGACKRAQNRDRDKEHRPQCLAAKLPSHAKTPQQYNTCLCAVEFLIFLDTAAATAASAAATTSTTGEHGYSITAVVMAARTLRYFSFVSSSS